MHFVHRGSGHPPLLFVHGFACAHGDWRHQLDFFSSTREVIACDLRGHGETPGRAHECTIENYGGDVAALVNNLELRDVILVGHSMGCRVVLEASRLVPKRVRGLVLIDGSRQGTAGDPAQAEALARSAIVAAGYAQFSENVFRQMFLQWSPLAEEIFARVKRMPPETGTALWANMVRWDVTQLDAALASVRVPLLAIQSTWITPERKRLPLEEGQSSPWLELLKSHGARAVVVPKTGHFTMLEAPAPVNRLIAEFGR
jgi:pimeloyl-ACP methyl ester carboxylesterase